MEKMDRCPTRTKVENKDKQKIIKLKDGRTHFQRSPQPVPMLSGANQSIGEVDAE